MLSTLRLLRWQVVSSHAWASTLAKLSAGEGLDSIPITALEGHGSLWPMGSQSQRPHGASVRTKWPCSQSRDIATSAHNHVLARPKPLPKFKRLPREEWKWKKFAIRFPPDVDVHLVGQNMVIAGKAGAAKINLSHMDPTGLVAMQLWRKPDSVGDEKDNQTLLICLSPSKLYFRGIATHIDNYIRGVTSGYLQGVAVQGVGFRIEPVDEFEPRSTFYFEKTAYGKSTAVYPHTQPVKAVRFKVGFTRTVIFPLPEGVLGFVLKPALMYLYGVDLAKVRSTAMAMRSVRPPNAYNGNGVRLLDEVIQLRQRKGGK